MPSLESAIAGHFGPILIGKFSRIPTLSNCDLVEEDRVVTPVGVDANECKRVCSRRHRETARGVGRVRCPRWCKCPDGRTVNLHLDGLAAGLEVLPLRGFEAQRIAAGREGDCLADAGRAVAQTLHEGDLAALWGIGIARGKTAAVAGQSRVTHESPS